MSSDRYSWFTNHAQSRSIKAAKGVIAVLDISAVDAKKVCEVLEYETAPLHETIATQALALESQSAELAKTRKLLQGIAELAGNDIPLPDDMTEARRLEYIAEQAQAYLKAIKRATHCDWFATCEAYAEVPTIGACENCIAQASNEAPDEATSEWHASMLEAYKDGTITVKPSSPASPKFKVGDKVRVAIDAEDPSEYRKGEYDTIHATNEDGVHKLLFANGELGAAFWWHDDELIAYEGES